ncbi:fimbrial protein [Vibrio sp. V08_P9A1T1]|uniref:fimbrial protein n=1 Tax=Vibrio sp. V08_P9A1T1 TaxID=1938663 RepID=UPI000B8E9030|nr:fimbrial protein [Vibrio sp. V08_P9A1T1]OXX26725.1 fimbrial protein [Vibrio sp. V08_P9A1T1]
MKKTIIASALMMLSASTLAAGANNIGQGEIKFVGSILSAPCSIVPGDSEQTVDMGQISNDVLEGIGETPVRPFAIHLESCSVDTAKTASVIFTGDADTVNTKDLAMHGTAKGASIALVSQRDGSHVDLGTASKAINLVAGDNTLEFGAKLVSNLEEGKTATPGDFSATANFVMSYQ